MRGVAAVVACVCATAAVAHAQRRPEIDADLRGRVSAGVSVGTGEAISIDPQLRYYVHDRLTVGTRMRFGAARTSAVEADVGVAVDVDTIRLIERFRTDTIVMTGTGVELDGTSFAFVGVALRVQPRTGDPFESSLVFELGGRATVINNAPLVGELTISALMLWPPVRRLRDCYICGWR
jgi:hypothetical protein